LEIISMAIAIKKTERFRIEIRVSPEEKLMLAQAAAVDHVDVTSFVKRAALPVAERRVAEAEKIRLSVRDAERMLQFLENPPNPAPALVAAARAKYASS
jgi:uncharacterized protein (DUF1778 family)